MWCLQCNSGKTLSLLELELKGCYTPTAWMHGWLKVKRKEREKEMEKEKTWLQVSVTKGRKPVLQRQFGV
ncbi:unnamed protein product [Pleuronectes platessa]|uniref:Uncharacterized protein n=1 Tax=Pleuronectes platessa TaxID=8262 RepID=A0A9N7VS89_PLEPL|nr:unnamed protein product [Pleuronectes platessa]